MLWLELAAALLILLFAVWPLYAGYRFVYPPRYSIYYTSPSSVSVNYKEVQLISHDGTQLAGWYFPPRNGAAVLLLHGHSSNRLAVLHHAEALTQAGYGVLMMDLRAHGASGGDRFAHSQAEVNDVLTAVAFLSKQPDVNAAGVGVLGIFTGGTLALQAAVKTVAIRAVVLDGPSPVVEDDLPEARSWLERLFVWRQRLFMKASRWFAKTDPLPAAGTLLPRLAPRPVLLIATGQRQDAHLANHYYEAATEPKQVWKIPEADHMDALEARPEEYKRRIVTFFNQSLVRQEAGQVTLPEKPPSQAAAAVSDSDSDATDATISLGLANLVALLLFPVSYLILFLPYRWLWGQSPLARFEGWSISGFLLGLLMLAVSILVHEGLHLAGFLWIGKAPRHSLKLGFHWKGLAPYAHCDAPMTASAYRLAVALPGLVLGLVPGLVGILAGWWQLVLWAALMLVTAGGDTAVLWAIRRVPGKVKVRDHPHKVGCQVLQPEPV